MGLSWYHEEAAMTVEDSRLTEARDGGVPWRRWGPYLSDRQWGTVREDESDNGDAWGSFSHDQARSRAYRWGEDGIAGICDDRQRLCLAITVWNGTDPILKERLFGLTNGEGNHGEDVKELYFYLDSTPSHSWMKCLYKYPQTAYPYGELVSVNGGRSRHDQEFELIDTNVLDDDRYFDVVVEYAKASPEDLLGRVTVHNRGPEPATIHVLPTLWFRNTWRHSDDGYRPSLARATTAERTVASVVATHEDLGPITWYLDGDPQLLFTENETNSERLFGRPNPTPFVKDGIDRFVVHGETSAVNPAEVGTKAAAHHTLDIAPGDSATVRFRLVADGGVDAPFGPAFDRTVDLRRAEADEFFDSKLGAGFSTDERAVVRQALAGMLWSKQYYAFDVLRWLGDHGVEPWNVDSRIRNHEWFHMVTDDVISMPDKWEYPWFAAWDLAFHAGALAMVDLDLAKAQLRLLLDELYLHPNGQLPAYEWNFSDVNPPVHAWATYFVYQREKEINGEGDLTFLRESFQKLLLNFTWWINRKDPTGRNVFQGGFLGLDNIGVFDRSAPLPTGGNLEQSDGTAWMALFSANMLQIALELVPHDAVYGDLALKFVEHFLWIAAAMDRIGDREDEMWDEEDGFFYDVLRLPDGSGHRLKVRSIVGLLPLAAATVISADAWRSCPEVVQRAKRFAARHADALASIADPTQAGEDDTFLLSILDEDKLRRVLTRLLDEDEFLSPYGIRSLSRVHLEHPYTLTVNGEVHTVGYLPAESDTGMFGGNSNWRGPIWFPMNGLIVRGLANLHRYYGSAFTVECPTGSGQFLDLYGVAREIVRRLASIFLPDENGRRPVHGGVEVYEKDPAWQDLILFYEYFHGDNGAGIGASHQTGWTGLIAPLLQLFGPFGD